MKYKLTLDQQQMITNRIFKLIEEFEVYADRNCLTTDKMLEAITFDIKGQCAGQFVVKRGNNKLRFNPEIFAKYWDDMFENTIPHEVAHYLVWAYYPGRCKPHGKEWREVMEVFDCEPEVTHNYNLSDIVRPSASFTYKCSCKEWELSKVRHNRSEKNGGHYYRCPKCKDHVVKL